MKATLQTLDDLKRMLAVVDAKLGQLDMRSQVHTTDTRILAKACQRMHNFTAKLEAELMEDDTIRRCKQIAQMAADIIAERENELNVPMTTDIVA